MNEHTIAQILFVALVVGMIVSILWVKYKVR